MNKTNKIPKGLKFLRPKRFLFDRWIKDTCQCGEPIDGVMWVGSGFFSFENGYCYDCGFVEHVKKLKQKHALLESIRQDKILAIKQWNELNE